MLIILGFILVAPIYYKFKFLASVQSVASLENAKEVIPTL